MMGVLQRQNHRLDGRFEHRVQPRILVRLLLRDKNWANGAMFQVPVATQKKVYEQRHPFLPKAEIGQFKIEAYDIKVGDKILVTGPSTGAQEMIIEEMFVNDTSAERATKGDDCTLKLPFRTECPTNYTK